MNPNFVVPGRISYSRNNNYGHSPINSTIQNPGFASDEYLAESRKSSTSLPTTGPYIRVYDRSSHEQSAISADIPSTTSKSSRPSKSKPIVLDVSKTYKSKSSTTSINVPSTLTKIVLGQQQSNIRNTPGIPQTLVLSRPRSNSTKKYSQSNSSTPSQGGMVVFDPSQSLLPFPILTNALKLYFQLKVLQEDEQIIQWICGSIVKQKHVLQSENPYSLARLFNRTKKDEMRVCPAYLLLTTKNFYIYKPTFQLSKLKRPLNEEQISYHSAYDPSKLLILNHKYDLNFDRIDVGLGRQYIAIHGQSSIVFLTMSKSATKSFIEHLRSLFSDHHMENVINQNFEYSVRNLQNYILLSPGKKFTNLFSTAVIDSNSLSTQEYDSAITEKVSKVDFEFVQLFLVCSIVKITKPVADSNVYGAEIRHCSLLSTRDYIYILQERLDVWPPAVFPAEYSIKSTGDIYGKGFLIDSIPQYTTMGVGRIKEACLIERWKSWRIDTSYGTEIGQQLAGLGRALQNGHIGHLRSLERLETQQGCTAGCIWWVRVSFKLQSGDVISRQPPNCMPAAGYFWDLAFHARESSSEFIETVIRLQGNLDTKNEIVLVDPED